MSANWGPIRASYKNNIDALSISNNRKTNFKRRINNTFNTNVMKNIVREAKAVANANGRVNNASNTNRRVNNASNTNTNGRVNNASNKNTNGRVNNASNTSTNRRVNNLAVRVANINLGRQNGLSTNVSEGIVTLSQNAARETVKLIKSGEIADALVSAVVLITGVLGSQQMNINANRVLNVFPRGLPYMQPYLSSTYTVEKMAKRAVFWFAQYKTKQFSPLYTLYEEAFSTFGKNKKSKVGEYMTSLFIYSYYAFIIAAMPKTPEKLKKFIKGTLGGLYQTVAHRYTLSVVTPIIITLMYQVYAEKLKLEASVAYKIYETLVGPFVEERSLQLLSAGGGLLAKKALPYFAKIKVRQLAPSQYRPALDIAVDTIVDVAEQRARIQEISPGGTMRNMTPRGTVVRTGNTPVATRTRSKTKTKTRFAPFNTPPSTPVPRRTR